MHLLPAIGCITAAGMTEIDSSVSVHMSTTRVGGKKMNEVPNTNVIK